MPQNEGHILLLTHPREKSHYLGSPERKVSVLRQLSGAQKPEALYLVDCASGCSVTHISDATSWST